VTPPVRISLEALTALRGYILAHFIAAGASEGQLRGDTDLWDMDLAEVLRAAFRYVREERPLLGRGGVVLDAPEDHHWSLAFAVDDALPGYGDPLTVDGCIAALQRAFPFQVLDTPAGRRGASPRAYPCRGVRLPDSLRDVDPEIEIFEIVAEEHWIRDPTRREQAFGDLLPHHWDPLHFVEIDGDEALALAAALLARRCGLEAAGERRVRVGCKAAARAFTRLFGDGTRVFALGEVDLEDPLARGHAWSAYDDEGNGSWGQILVLVVTDGTRAAYLDVRWDVSSE